MIDHTDVVERVKADLEKRGINLQGPCGAFEITKRVVWALRSEGCGLLDKPGGNNCQGYSTDFVIYPDGHGYDILVSAGDINGPSWQDGGVADASRWRPPIDPLDTIIVDPPKPSPLPAPVSTDFTALIARLEESNRRLEALKIQVEASTEKIQQQLDQIVKDAEATMKKIIPLIGGGNILGEIGNLFGKK